jgi:hypothetical protein
MSYQNVFFGDLKKKNFYSNGTDLSSDIIENVYEVIYFPNKFTNHELLEFSSLNLGVNIRVYNEDKTVMVFYLTEYDPLFYDSDIKRNIDNSIGHIQINIDKGDDKDMTITWIGIEERFRGKGLAKYLITLALLYTSIYAPDVTSVILDDDTDNYANGIKDKKEREEAQGKNLYCKMGFEYVDKTGHPEMIGVTSELVKENIRFFVKKRERSLSKSRSMSKSRSSSGSRRKKRRDTRSMSRSKRPVTRSMSRSKRPATRSMSRSRKKTKRS